MREGGPASIESQREQGGDIFARLKAGLDYVVEQGRELLPTSREARLLLELGVFAAMAARAIPEAHAESTGHYTHEVKMLEHEIRRAEAQLAAGMSGALLKEDAEARLAKVRAVWEARRKADHKHINLRAETPKEVKEYFAAYHIKISDTTRKKAVARIWYVESYPRYEAVDQPIHNVLDLSMDEDIVFDQNTYDVRFQWPGGARLDILAYNIDGTVEVYHLSNGMLTSVETAAHEEDLPYPKIRAKYERKDRQASFWIPQKKKK
jgi:hypothetical protein